MTFKQTYVLSSILKYILNWNLPIPLQIYRINNYLLKSLETLLRHQLFETVNPDLYLICMATKQCEVRPEPQTILFIWTPGINSISSINRKQTAKCCLSVRNGCIGGTGFHIDNSILQESIIQSCALLRRHQVETPWQEFLCLSRQITITFSQVCDLFLFERT